MNILLLSYSEISLRRGSVRAVAMVYALADAGHRIDVVAPRIDLPDHPNIHTLVEGGGTPVRRSRLRRAGRLAVRRNAYDAVHAVDDAVFPAARLCRRKRTPLIYDAVRCFSGKAAARPAGIGGFFPQHVKRMESSILQRAAVVFSNTSRLTADLKDLDPTAGIVQLEDIAAQPLYPHRRSGVEARSGRPTDPVVLCSVLPGHTLEIRELLMAARKVIDAVPDARFFIIGTDDCGKAEEMAFNLDIAGRCTFLPADDPESFLAALDRADAVLMVPPGRYRYIHPQVFTLLQAGAPLVAVHDPVYDGILTGETSLQVLPNAESIAEGLLRAIQEPLFQLSVTLEGQQLVADRHTYSSFKHKVRMIYRDLGTQK